MSTNLSLQERHERCLYPCVRIRTPKALGSGTILYYENAPDAPGQVDRYVLTNEHVIDNLVAVEKRWNSMLRREVKVDILGLPTVEVFTFAYTSRTIGFTGYQAEIVAYDKEEDLALLRVRAPAVGPIYAATLVPREQVNDLQSFMGCWNIGCGLGAKPVLTFGYLSAFGYDIENKDYMQVSAPSIFGNCLPGDALVSLANGAVRPLMEVRPGDTVWSVGPSGLSKNTVVNVVSSGAKEIFSLRTRTRTIRASANHPLLALETTKGWDGRVYHVPVWKPVSEIQEGDVIAVLSGLPERERTEGFNFAKELGQDADWASFMRFLGFYLGDGWLRHEEGYRYEVSLACYDQGTFERYSKIVIDLFGLRPTNHAAPDVLQVNSKELVGLLERTGVTGKATEKTVPDWVMTAPVEMQEAFLAGYLEADGHINSGGAWVFEANNEVLIRRLRMLCIHMGYAVSNVHVRMREATEVNGRACVPSAPSASFQVYPTYRKARSTALVGTVVQDVQGLCWERVSNIVSNGVEETYDIQVDARSCFFAEGVLVHNSGGATFLEETGEMIGVPARISVSGFGDAITHIGFSITAERIYKFLDEHVFDFVYGSGRTSEECAQERKKRREMDVDKRSQREEDEED